MEALNHYEQREVLGQGTYGVCHLAIDRRNGMQYAMKRITLRNEKDAQSAQKEADVLSELKHPNVVGYRESFSDEFSLYIIVAYCEEGDLHAHIKRAAEEKEPFSELQIMDWLCELVSALAYIHGKRILHRDLKTQNIFLSKGKHVQLGDFGISKVLESTCDFATTFTGTPFYMAPEVCSNNPYTLKSDVWSLGCVVYEMCGLKHAFSGDNLVSLIMQIVSGTYPPIPETFGFPLSNLVDMLLARDESMRPTSRQIFELPLIQHHLASMAVREVLLQGTVTGRRSRSTLGKSSSRSARQQQSPPRPGTRPPPILPPPSPQSPGVGSFSPPAPEGPPPGPVLTPAQRLAAKKRAEAEARQQALSAAAEENLHNRSVARDHHLQQFRGGAGAPPLPLPPPSPGPSASPRGAAVDSAPVRPMGPSPDYHGRPLQADGAGWPGWADSATGDTVLYGGSTASTLLPQLESLSLSGSSASAGAAPVAPAPPPWDLPRREGRAGPPPPPPAVGDFSPWDRSFGGDTADTAAAEEVEEEVYEANFDSDGEPAPEYIVPMHDVDSRLEALRLKARGALGDTVFERVYEYLSDVRRQHDPPDELAIKTQLMQIVQRKDRVPLCFQVYQEIMFQDNRR